MADVDYLFLSVHIPAVVAYIMTATSDTVCVYSHMHKQAPVEDTNMPAFEDKHELIVINCPRCVTRFCGKV